MFTLKLENGLTKHVRNVARTKDGFVKLVVIFFTMNTGLNTSQDIVPTTFFIKLRGGGLARDCPHVEPIATPSSCLYKNVLKIKYDSLIAKDSNSFNSDLFKTWTLLFWLYIDSVQMVTVFPSRILLKSEFMSKLPK